MCLTVIYIFRVLEIDETNGNDLPLESILDVRVIDGDLPETNSFRYKVVENAFGADKFTMITNPDGSGSLKIIKVSFSLCYKLPSTVACRHTFEVSDIISDRSSISSRKHNFPFNILSLQYYLKHLAYILTKRCLDNRIFVNFLTAVGHIVAHCGLI